MNLYDVIFDKDANIMGILINESDNVFNVLWKNNVIGIVTDADTALNVVSHIDMQAFIIEDILHTGNSGIEFTSKVGTKYDSRRNKIVLINMQELKKGSMLTFYLFRRSFFDKIQETGYVCKTLHTTEFDCMYEENGYIMLRTINSIYKLRSF